MMMDAFNDKLNTLTDLILEWNEKINVTAIRDRDDFIKKNVEDSLTVMERPEFADAGFIMDLGTGGGFPGLPLAVCNPDKEFILIDSVGKKLKVVSDVAEKLGLSNVKVIHTRAEDLASKPEYREGFDLVVSRAVANMSTLSEYCLPFVKTGGYFIAFKTAAAIDEINSAANAIRLLGGEGLVISDNACPDDDHLFVIVKKVNPTSKKYPRKAGLPSKQPL